MNNRREKLDKIWRKVSLLCEPGVLYKVQFWLILNDKRGFSLRVSTLVSGTHEICDTYAKVKGKKDIHTYKANPGLEFILIYEIQFSERVESENHSAQHAAEAYSFLISKLWEYQYDCDSKYYIPFYTDITNDQITHHARHWEDEFNFKKVMDSLFFCDCFHIIITEKLHKVFKNLDVKYHAFYELECIPYKIWLFSCHLYEG